MFACIQIKGFDLKFDADAFQLNQIIGALNSCAWYR